ncbi:2501_t:CDS:2 [Gigaspora rosea]|nr:2501_t:CDS:2 [Gigaspora rosea]
MPRSNGQSRQVSFRLWFDKVFIKPKMIKEKQKQNNTSFLEGLQILLEGMLPNGQHKLKDYKSQMNLINNEITDTPAFFTALSRVYDYYKSEKKKKKENRFKKNEFAIVPLRNMKCYNCRRKGHLMSDCRSKKQEKGYKGKKFSKEKFLKDRNRKEFNKKVNKYTNKKGRSWKSKEEYKKWKKSRKRKNLFKPFKFKEERFKKSSFRPKDSLGQYGKIYKPFNKEKYKDKKIEQYHLENEYSSSEESQSYQEPE